MTVIPTNKKNVLFVNGKRIIPNLNMTESILVDIINGKGTKIVIEGIENITLNIIVVIGNHGMNGNITINNIVMNLDGTGITERMALCIFVSTQTMEHSSFQLGDKNGSEDRKKN
jgi:hypothetical protein